MLEQIVRPEGQMYKHTHSWVGCIFIPNYSLPPFVRELRLPTPPYHVTCSGQWHLSKYNLRYVQGKTIRVLWAKLYSLKIHILKL